MGFRPACSQAELACVMRSISHSFSGIYSDILSSIVFGIYYSNILTFFPAFYLSRISFWRSIVCSAMILFGMYTLHMVNATTSKAWLLCDNAAQEPLHLEGMPKETLEKEDSNPM